MLGIRLPRRNVFPITILFLCDAPFAFAMLSRVGFASRVYARGLRAVSREVGEILSCNRDEKDVWVPRPEYFIRWIVINKCQTVNERHLSFIIITSFSLNRGSNRNRKQSQWPEKRVRQFSTVRKFGYHRCLAVKWVCWCQEFLLYDDDKTHESMNNTIFFIALYHLHHRNAKL